MSGLVARQPILDSQLKTVGYELLFREGTENLFTRGDPDGATFSVMSSVIDENDLGVLANGRPLFLNFTRALLLGEYAQLLPKDMVVIEIVENLNPDEDLLASCSRLKKDGYRLALDDVVSPEICLPYLDVIDILKVDFLLTDAAMRQRLADEFLPRGIVMLAEKVETHEAWRQAEESGYTLFQGFFFSKPKMVASRQIPQSKSTEFMLIREVTQMDCDMQRVEKIIMHDPVISVKLLKYINSAAFALRSPVRSIRNSANGSW
jgi:c-di-GMP-related signal transduction protein